jgi:hypothetical protein
MMPDCTDTYRGWSNQRKEQPGISRVIKANPEVCGEFLQS